RPQPAGPSDRRWRGGRSDSYLLFRTDDLGGAGRLAIDAGPAFKLPDAALGAEKAGFENQLIARYHGLAEAQLVRADEHVERAVVRFGFHHPEAEDTRRLRHRLDDQHARHDRMAREMPLEEGLVDRYVLVGANTLGIHVQLTDPVDQQERVAVRQVLANLVDVHHVRKKPVRIMGLACAAARLHRPEKPQSDDKVRHQKPYLPLGSRYPGVFPAAADDEPTCPADGTERRSCANLLQAARRCRTNSCPAR